MNRSGSAHTLKSSTNFGNENNSMLLEQSMRSQFMSNTMLRDKSPNRTIIAQLAEKLTNTHLTAKDQEQFVKKDAQKQLQQIESEIDNLQKSTEGEIGYIKEEAARIEESLDLERKKKEILLVQDDKKTAKIENSMEIEINNEKYNIAQLSPHDSLNPSAFGEKFYSLKLDLAKEKKLREETSYEFFSDVEERLGELRGDIDHLNKTRSEANEKLVKRLGQEINAFHQILAEERKKRKDMHDQIINLVKNMQKKVMQELAQEKIEREETEESLIKLLEDA